MDLPAVDLVPDVIAFNGGKLSHHVNQSPPWQATGSLSIFHKTLDMSPNSHYQGCSVVGGLSFYEDGGLASAGAVLQNLEIPIPNPPAPNPVTAITNPAFQVLPATSSRPLDLIGCLSLSDYPDADAFTVTGCASFLSAGSGKSIPTNADLPFCPDQNGNEKFALTDQNSVVDPANHSRRILRGIVLRGTGTVGLGPKAYKVAQAYLEFRDSPFAVEFKGHFGDSFLDGHLNIGADLFGDFYSPTHWEVGGEGGVTQDLICVPLTDICPSASVAALVAYQGIGACVTIFSIGVGASIRFRDLHLEGHFPGCDLQDLKDDLGIQTRALPSFAGLRAASAPLAQGAQAGSGTVDLSGGAPYALVVVRGTDHSPVVEVRDPSGKVVLDDTGAAVQGLPAPKPGPAPVDLATQTPAAADTSGPSAPQGIIHDELSPYHDDTVDLRHTTLLLIRAPKAGKYTITAKPGSSPITAISHSLALPTTTVTGGVVGSGDDRMLTLQSALPAGETMTLTEEGTSLTAPIGTVSGSARAASVRAGIARVSRHIAFHPALGPAGKRKIVAVVTRDGIPVKRIVLGSYVAPKPPKAGKVHGLKAKLRGSKLSVSWKPAKHAATYVVTVKLRHGLSFQQSVKGSKHKLVLSEALARLGATVTVQPIGPLSTAGPAATRKVAPAKVKRIKHFVL